MKKKFSKNIQQSKEENKKIRAQNCDFQFFWHAKRIFNNDNVLIYIFYYRSRHLSLILRKLDVNLGDISRW